MGEIKAGVVVVNRFCGANDKKFAQYINYLEGSEEVRQKYLSEYSLYNDYMDDSEKATGLFTDGNTNLIVKDKKILKEAFQTAQDNGSLMWQTVISFDNRWLEQNGLYDADNKILDERRLKVYATDAINKMLENENLGNAIWSAGIHYNTDNVHIHVAIVEPHPQRETKMVKQYSYERNSAGEYVKASNGSYVKANGRNELNKWGVPLPRYSRKAVYDEKGNRVESEEYVGRFKGKSIKMCKSEMVNSIMNEKENNILLNRIIRERIVKSKRENPLIQDEELKDQFLKLYQKMPATKRSLWNYNNNVMASVRSEIDGLISFYLDKYHPEDMKQLETLLEKQAEAYRLAYGATKRNFKDRKIKELYERMGNALLKELRDYDKNKVFIEEIQPKYDEGFMTNQEEEPWLDPEDEPEMDGEGKTVVNKSYLINWSKDYKSARTMIFQKAARYKEAFDLLEKEGSKGNVLAIYELAEMYKYGRGVSIDLQKAEEYYKESYDGFEILYKTESKMKAYLAYRLGKQNKFGLGVERDLKKAFTYFEYSANNGNSYAQYYLGNMYYMGQGVEKDYEKALEYYEQSSKCDKGNAYATYKLGKMYEEGIGTEVNLEEAEKNYKMAYNLFEEMENDQESDGVEYRLGIMNLLGKGTEKNELAAKEYFEKAADSGNPYAQYQLAKLYLKSGKADDINTAIILLEKSADKGENTMAQYALGKIYMSDNGDVQDIHKAEFWLKKAAGKDNEYAMYSLGKLYERAEYGIGNYEKSIEFYEKAAKRGNEYACFSVGKLLAKSSDAKEQIKAAEWLEKACRFNNQYAQYALGKIYIDVNGALYKPERGIEMLTKAADQGNQYAQCSLGIEYLRGKVVEKNKDMSVRYLTEAADQGNQYAAELLENIKNEKRFGRIHVKKDKRFGYELERALNALKRSLNNVKEKYLNEQIYIHLQEKIHDENIDI